MLTFVFFGIVFSSAVWLIYAVRFVGESLSGMNLFDAGLLNVVLYTLFVCLPLFVLWAVFGFISQYVYNRMASRQLFRLFSQMKKIRNIPIFWRVLCLRPNKTSKMCSF